MSNYTLESMAAAARRCLANPLTKDDAVTARSLLRCIELGDTADNLEATDQWFNTTARLPELMTRYGEPA